MQIWPPKKCHKMQKTAKQAKKRTGSFLLKSVQATSRIQHAQLPAGTARHPPRPLPPPASSARDGDRPLQVLSLGSLHQGRELSLSAYNKSRQKFFRRRQELCASTSICAASAGDRRRGTLHPLPLPQGCEGSSHPIRRPGKGPRAHPAHAHSRHISWRWRTRRSDRVGQWHLQL